MKRAFILFYFIIVTYGLFGQASTYVKYYNELGRTYQGVPDGGGNYYFLQADKNTSLTSIFKLNEHGVKIAESEKLSSGEPGSDFLVLYGSTEIALVMSGTGTSIRYYDENLIFQEEHYLLQADTMEILKVAASQNRMVFLFAGQSGKYYLGYATSRTNLDWIIDLPDGSHSVFRKFSLSINNDGKVLVGYSSNLFGLYDSTGNKLWGGNYPFREVSGFTENNFYIKLGSQLNKISFNSGIIWEKTLDYSNSGLLERLDSERLFFGIETDSNFVYTIYDSSGTKISGSVINHKQDSKSIKVNGEYVYVQGNKGIMKIHEELPFRGLYTYFLSSKFTP